MRRRRVTVSLRNRVAQAARYRCGYCLTSERVVGPALEIDHLVPESRGGRTTEDNLWLACPLCNGHKADHVEAADPVTGEVVPLFNLRRQRWAEHFEWSADGTLILGRTPSGRATVEALKVNDPAMVASRRLWVIAGWHPPEPD